jgi:hypothetical protein
LKNERQIYAGGPVDGCAEDDERGEDQLAFNGE